MVKFGVSVPTGREGLMVPTGFASKETIVDAGKLAEELGYYSVWGNDHITVQRYIRHLRPMPSFFDPLISMAALSSVTSRIKLATGVFVLPWRTPSLVICAKQLATLDVLSGRRLILGVGTGAYPEESAALNISDNLGRLNEGVEGLRVLFEEPRATYNGRYVRFKDVQMWPKPIQRPLPIYLGRHKTTTPVLRWIAAHGQGWIPALSPEQFAEAIPRLKKVLKDRGMEEICPLNAPFDPYKHEAVERLVTDEHPHGHVLEVFQKGYALNDRVLQPAAVKVAASPSEPSPETEGRESPSTGAEARGDQPQEKTQTEKSQDQIEEGSKNG